MKHYSELKQIITLARKVGVTNDELRALWMWMFNHADELIDYSFSLAISMLKAKQKTYGKEN